MGRSSSSPEKSKRTLLRLVLIIIGWIVGVFVIGIFALFLVIGFLLNGFGNSCQAKRSVVYSQAQAATPAFNRLVIIVGLAGKPAVESKQDGDCGDSLPTAWLNRTFQVHETAGAAMAQVTASLHNEGYVGPVNAGPSSDTSPCGVDQAQSFSKSNLPTIAISTNCDDTRATNNNWQSLPVTQVNAELTFTASP